MRERLYASHVGAMVRRVLRCADNNNKGGCPRRGIHRCLPHRRGLSNLDDSNKVEPIFHAEAFRTKLIHWTPAIAESLQTHGYWSSNSHGEEHRAALEHSEVQAMRAQSIALRQHGRFEPSWSERIDEHGVATRFDKPGVWACEPDGGDYDLAPDLLHYLSSLISTLPPLLNAHVNTNKRALASTQDTRTTPLPRPLNLSDQAFNAKLAVTLPGGSTYPLHVDNSLGVSGNDMRKLTCILYLNPDYNNNTNETPTTTTTQHDGGELRLLLLNQQCVDLPPVGMVIFWSDEIPHEVLPCKPDSTDAKYDRYALTVWLPDHDPTSIQSPDSKFAPLRTGAFVGEPWC